MKRNGKSILFVLALLFFAGMAVFSGYKVYTIAAEYRAGEKSAQSMQQYITMEPAATEVIPPAAETPTSALQNPATPVPTEPVAATEPTEPVLEFPVVDFEGLQEVNPEVLGWICIEGTNVNYPLVQAADNDYYLTHLPDRSTNSSGSIFLDYRNAPDFSDYHTVIYGHNMKNGTMFAQINKYKEAEFYEANRTGMIMTPQKNMKLEVIGGYVADLWDPAWELYFESEEASQDWLRDAMERSTVGGDYVVVGGEKIITLSTCSYEFDDARFVLILRVLETFDAEN